VTERIDLFRRALAGASRAIARDPEVEVVFASDNAPATGKTARVVERCTPTGKVAVGGEIWNARCEQAAEVGETVRVQGLEGLTLLVELDQATVSEPANHHKT